MTHHRSVLKRCDDESGENDICFDNDEDAEPGDEGYMESYYMDSDIWKQMGKPDEITITVQPGDVLNEPGGPRLFSGSRVAGAYEPPSQGYPLTEGHVRRGFHDTTDLV